MKIGTPQQNKILVSVVQVSPHKPKDKDDTRTTDRTTIETFQLFEATPEQVTGVVRRALEAASK